MGYSSHIGCYFTFQTGQWLVATGEKFRRKGVRKWEGGIKKAEAETGKKEGAYGVRGASIMARVRCGSGMAIRFVLAAIKHLRHSDLYGSHGHSHGKVFGPVYSASI